MARPGTRPVSLWRQEALAFRPLARRVWDEIWAHEILDRAAALSYYFLFALFPALLFLTAVLGLLPWTRMDDLLAYADRVLPGDAASLVRKTLAEVVRGAGRGLLSVGAAGALWAASSGMLAMMTALNIVYDFEDRRPWWRRRLIAIGLTLGFAALIPTALVLLVFGERLGALVADWTGLSSTFVRIWPWLRWPILVACVLAGVELIFAIAPARRRRWRWITPGSLFAVLVWLAMSLGLRAYVAYFGNYNATYGSIGGVILLLLWLYLTGVVLLVGAEIDAEVGQSARLS